MEKMTVAQLKEVCDQKGLSYTSRTSKADLITMLSGTKIVAEAGRKFAGEY